MTIPRELAFCESYARECFSGAGRLIDLGCWYGATTFSLARGLTRNRQAKNNRVIEAFDLFIWRKAMEAEAEKIGMPRRYRVGESFYLDVLRLLEPYKEVVRLHQQDLLQYKPTPLPVEFLFVDAMKSWKLAEKIIANFFPLLIPGKSIVVQQDFIFHQPIAATNHLLMWRLRDHFDWLHQIPGSGSVVFVCKKQIEAAELPNLEPESFSLEEIDQAYDYGRACVLEEDRRPYVEAAKLLFLIERGYCEAALKHARWLSENRVKFREHVLADARELIGQTTAMSANKTKTEFLAEITSLLAAP